MSHVLAKITGAPFEDVRKQLEIDASTHAEQGMHLEHLWRNDDDPSETLFLFRVENLEECKQRMNKVHAETLKENPDVTLPELTFLTGT